MQFLGLNRNLKINIDERQKNDYYKNKGKEAFIYGPDDDTTSNRDSSRHSSGQLSRVSSRDANRYSNRDSNRISNRDSNRSSNQDSNKDSNMDSNKNNNTDDLILCDNSNSINKVSNNPNEKYIELQEKKTE